MARKGINIFLGLNSKEFDDGMKKMQGKLRDFGRTYTRLGANLSRSLTLPIAGAGLAALKMASDFEETDQKFNTVFASLGDHANDLAKEFQRSFGLSSKEAKTLLSSTGDLLVGFGFTEKAAFELAIQTNSLAADLASFSNIEGGTATASKALTKALVGETESAKALGVVIRQGTKDYKDRVRNIQMSEGVTELQAKALLNLRIAAEQSGKAIGDVARTQDSLANQTRFAKSAMIDLSVQMGQILLPIAKMIVERFRTLVYGFIDLTKEQKENIVKWLAISAAIGPVIFLAGKLAFALGTLGKAFHKFTGIIAKNPFLAFVGGAAAAIIAIDNLINRKRDLSNLNKAELEAQVKADKKAADSADKAYKKALKNVELAQRAGGAAGGNRLASASGRLASTSAAADEATEALEQSTAALAALNEVEIKGSDITKDLSGELQTLIDSLSTGDNSVVGAYEETTKASREWKLQIVADAEEAAKRLARFSAAINELIKGAVTSMLELTGQALGNMLTGAGGWKDFGNSILKIIGQFLIDLGKSLILYSSLIEGFKQAWKIPEAGIALGLAAIAAGGAFMNLAEKGVPAMAEGGIVTGPTLALIGEGSESEVVLPLSKLSSMMQTGGTQKVIVEGMISGQDILLSNDRARKRRNRVR